MAETSRRGQKIWAVLLVVDSLFVIIFGGALAAKVYHHWQAVPELPAPPRRFRAAPPKPEPAPAPPAESPSVKPEPPKEREPEKTAPAANSIPKAARKRSLPPAEKSAVLPPKPSLIHEVARRESARPQETAAPAAKADGGQDSGGKPRAVPVQFQIKAPGARSVELGGAFLVRSGGRKAMVHQGDGNWKLTIYLTPAAYRYYFLVNGKKTLDPENSQVERGASVKTVE
ncbi:MAG: hypothetical protein HY549_05795 [Elusimicrobia bacterium]|nr:hypothetical protein [Elusimicrobiota bacterium]